MARRDDDRIAYLAGEQAGPLTASELAELDELRELLGAPATWEQPDPTLEDRVVAAITEEVEARPASPRERRTRSGGRLFGRRRGQALAGAEAFRGALTLRRPAYAAAGVAAAVAAAVVIVVSLNTTSPAPQRLAMVVSGTALAPEAHGSATLTKTSSGWRIALSATGLPRLANGRFYEAWLKNTAGTLVPVGTFNDARQVTLWAGVSPKEFPSLSVTRQRANGNPASSGERVLTGTARAEH